MIRHRVTNSGRQRLHRCGHAAATATASEKRVPDACSGWGSFKECTLVRPSVSLPGDMAVLSSEHAVEARRSGEAKTGRGGRACRAAERSISGHSVTLFFAAEVATFLLTSPGCRSPARSVSLLLRCE